MFLLASSSEIRLRAQNIRVLTVFSLASLANFRPPHSLRDFRQWKIALRFKSTKQPPDMRNADADGAHFGIQACPWRESVPPKKAFRHIPLTAPRPSYTTCRCPRKRQRTAPLAPGGGPAASFARRLLLPRRRSPGAVPVSTVLRFGRGEARAHAARQTHWRGPAPRATAKVRYATQ